jgi:uncharacterized protein (DUF3820 family)
MINREDKIKLFVNEINDIKDNNLRAFATELIASAPDYFFTVAASSSGKYHPPFDLGEGGLVRHTRFVVFIAESVAMSYCYNDRDTDMLIVAALAHDIQKQGSGDGKHTVWEHPELAMEYVWKIYDEHKFDIPKKDIEIIANAVHSHMGKWGNNPSFLRGNKPLPMPKTEFEKALQVADYIASRREITDFAFRETEVVTLPLEPKGKPASDMSLMELEMYEMPFGKHKGKTLKEIKPTGYLDWMIKQTDFNNKETQEIVRAYFDKLREFTTSDGKQKVLEENKEYLSAEKFINNIPKEETNLSEEEVDDLPF